MTINGSGDFMASRIERMIPRPRRAGTTTRSTRRGVSTALRKVVPLDQSLVIASRWRTRERLMARQVAGLRTICEPPARQRRFRVRFHVSPFAPLEDEVLAIAKSTY